MIKFREYFSIKFIKFVGVSGGSAVLNLLLRYLFCLRIGYEISIIISYIISTTFAYCLNRKIVFRHSTNSIKKQIFGFIVVNIIGMIQTLIISVLIKDYIFVFLDFSFYPSGIAHFIGLGSTAFTSFIGHNHLSFAEEKDNADEMQRL